MSDLQVAIPSSGRVDTLAAKTLQLLCGRGVPPDRVTVFVAGSELGAYRPVAERFGVHLAEGAPGMGANRNAIARHYPPGTPVVQADDDLDDLRQRVNAKLTVPVPDLWRFFHDGFDTAAMHGANLWGVYPVLNPMFMKPRVRAGLAYIVGCLWGAVQRGEPHQLVELDDKEDYERTLRYYVHDGAVVRIEWAAPKTRYYTEPGGMQQDRTPARVTASAQQVARTWPLLATVTTSRGRGTAELRLRDRRPK